MARPIRIEYEGAMYHVMCRGNNGRDIFFGDDGCKKFQGGIAVGLPFQETGVSDLHLSLEKAFKEAIKRGVINCEEATFNKKKQGWKNAKWKFNDKPTVRCECFVVV